MFVPISVKVHTHALTKNSAVAVMNSYLYKSNLDVYYSLHSFFIIFGINSNLKNVLMEADISDKYLLIFLPKSNKSLLFIVLN